MFRLPNASVALSCVERCSLIEAEMVLIRSSTNHSWLFYFVLTFEKSCIGPVMFPTLSMWNGPKSDVCSFGFVSLLFVLFFFFFKSCLGFFFFWFCFFVQALEIKSHSVFMLTPHISSNSKRFLGGLCLSLSQKMAPQRLLYLFCICEMFK